MHKHCTNCSHDKTLVETYEKRDLLKKEFFNKLDSI